MCNTPLFPEREPHQQDGKLIKPVFGHGLLKTRVLYVSDLDGTLLTPDAEVSPRSAYMLNEAIAGGTLFTVATARTPATVVPSLSDVNMQLPAVVMTGAALYDLQTRNYSRVCTLSAETVQKLIHLYRKHEVATFIYTIEGDMLQVYHIGVLNDFERQFMELRAGTPFKTFHVPPHGESQLPMSTDNTILLFSVQPWQRAYSLYEEICRNSVACTPLCYHDAFGPDWGELEVFGPQTSKAAAVEAIASITGAGRIVAFGDNVNDMPLFALADEKIAVSGAIDSLKAVATDVIGSNADDAVASFILTHYRASIS